MKVIQIGEKALKFQLKRKKTQNNTASTSSINSDGEIEPAVVPAAALAAKPAAALAAKPTAARAAEIEPGLL